MTTDDRTLENTLARADSVAVLLGNDEALPDGTRYHASELLRALLDEIGQLARERGAKKARATPKAATAGLAELLSIAYRSNRIMRNNLASVYLDLLEHDGGPWDNFDPSWTLEGLDETARRGYEALLRVGEAIGVDEDDLARYVGSDKLAEICAEEAMNDMTIKHPIDLFNLFERIDAIVYMLGTDEEMPGGKRYFASEVVRDLLRDIRDRVGGAEWPDLPVDDQAEVKA